MPIMGETAALQSKECPKYKENGLLDDQPSALLIPYHPASSTVPDLGYLQSDKRKLSRS